MVIAGVVTMTTGQWRGPGLRFILEGADRWQLPFRLAARHGNSHVSVLRTLPVLRKYCGFSMTGIFVIPMMTASGPISEDDGVLLPLETWWRGLAESSSLLMTDEEPDGGKGKITFRDRTSFCLIGLAQEQITAHIISGPNFISDYYILVGDYNVAQNIDLDCKGNISTSYHPQAQKQIKLSNDG